MAEIITIFKEIIVIIAMIFGMFIAWRGLRTWNDQLKGTTKYKIAKDVLTKTFKLRDEFERTRAPLMTKADVLAEEMSRISGEKRESNEEGKTNKNLFFDFEIYDKQSSKLNDSSYNDIKQGCNDIKQELEKLKIAADTAFGKKKYIERLRWFDDMKRGLEEVKIIADIVFSKEKYVERFSKLNDIKQELEIAKIEADAIFGKGKTEDIQKLIEKVYEMNRSFAFLQEIKYTSNWRKKEKKVKNFIWILSNTRPEGDNFGKDIIELVNKIESKFKKYLK